MRFAGLDHFFTGVSVPVAALRTAEDCGVGEFADLPMLADWCAGAGLEVVQILPVNDTGMNSSPYSALSAYALHPLYLRLQDLPWARRRDADIKALRTSAAEKEASASGHFDHREVLAAKLRIAEQLFIDNRGPIRSNRQFTAWRAANPWVPAYAVFSSLKRERNSSPWSSWGSMANPGENDIRSYWKDNEDQCLCTAWIQYHLESQLSAASRALEEKGIFLKGDLPILMSRESADVWAARRYFDLSAKAGAPPDMFSPDGQNWGFPVYDWEKLGAEGYRWWKDRLAQAGKFFHALRIDHVLGFFRIWRIPGDELTGLLGRFSPAAGVAPSDLHALGFDDGRIRWLTLPHIPGGELEAAVGSDAARVSRLYLSRIGSEDLYNIRPELDSEAAIHALPEPGRVRDFLLSRHADRTFLLDPSGIRFPCWYFSRTRAFRSLSDGERSALEELISRRRRDSEKIWESGGREILSTLRDATDMLVCAEDLGDVPDCVPRVLSDLGILGLRILRWSREYRTTAPGQPAPFIPLSRYPRLSVCTPSVHDTSTVRGWWEEDPGEREAFHRFLGLSGTCPPHMTADLQELILSRCLDANSLLCMFQVQDILDLDQELWSPDPQADRINVPGTVNDSNWTWRMPLAVEDLLKRNRLRERLCSLVARRRAKPLDGGGR